MAGRWALLGGGGQGGIARQQACSNESSTQSTTGRILVLLWSCLNCPPSLGSLHAPCISRLSRKAPAPTSVHPSALRQDIPSRPPDTRECCGRSDDTSVRSRDCWAGVGCGGCSQVPREPGLQLPQQGQSLQLSGSPAASGLMTHLFLAMTSF